MSERSAKGVLVAAIVWIVIFGAVGALYKFMVRPTFEEKTRVATSSRSQYKSEIRIAADAFSGYAVLRSEKMSDLLRDEGVKLTVLDDQADYKSRIENLETRDLEMAVFTVDSLITAGARLANFPGTIVMAIDESKGADKVVAYKDQVGSIEDLDDAGARIILTPDSPSEFLARVTLENFRLPNLSEDWLTAADGAEDVYRRFKSAKGKNEKTAYVLWEPFASQALDEEGAHTLLDSSNLKGMILDVLAVERTFLRSNPALVQKVVESYFRARFHAANSAGGFESLFQEDAKRTGSSRLSEEQASNLNDTIQLKNTLENFAHFGLLSDRESEGLTHIEDSIGNIVRVLQRSGVFEGDPLNGDHVSLFYDGILRNLQSQDFHPGTLGLVQGVGPGAENLDKVRGERVLPKLDDGQWNKLIPIGTLEARPLRFGRGTARINIQSDRDLGELAGRLESWPNYYLRVIGQTRSEGDPDANRILAQERAEAAASLLIEKGVTPNRIRAEADPNPQSGGGAQSVRFVFGQLPY